MKHPNFSSHSASIRNRRTKNNKTTIVNGGLLTQDRAPTRFTICSSPYGSLSDSRHRVGDNDARQTRAILEGPISDFRHRVGDDDAR